MKWYERCKALREDLNPKMNQTELGKVFNMSQKKISRLETGQAQITPDEIGIYCRFFNVSADYLLGFTVEYKEMPKNKERIILSLFLIFF